MLTKYFKFKVNTNHFKEDLKKIVEESSNKKILAFINSEEFVYLNKIYKFSENLNFAGIVLTDKNKKFKNKNLSINIIDLSQVKDIKFEEILVLDSDSEKVINNLKYQVFSEDTIIKTPFIEYVKEEKSNLTYLLKYNFDKTIKKTVKKLKNKTVMLYGAGIFFQVIKEYFDLSQLNIIGIVDKKYCDKSNDFHLHGYKLYLTEDIKNLKPDYVLIMTKIYIPIWEGLYFGYLDKTKVKILPIVKKNLIDLLNDIIKS